MKSMKLNLGQVITVLAEIGVILGIVFLAIQVNQGNKLIRGQADYQYTRDRVAWHHKILLDPEYAEFIVRAQDKELKTEVDLARLRAYYTSTLLDFNGSMDSFSMIILWRVARDLLKDGKRSLRTYGTTQTPDFEIRGLVFERA
ncbi:hypothetical protein [Microbulbifer sp. DLAB2-AA]|uniref:hypothetical protein n=1 Tax=Microbulbifer sp. DLAB2-AA TaxID=3243394 RepID=UPI0040395613